MAGPLIDETASCACGAVTVTARGRVLSMLLCACRDCRKATGTGHSALVVMRAGNVAIAGSTRHFERIAHSSARISRHFCPRCGTPVHGVTARAPDLVLLPAGLFDDPHWFAPSQAIFARSHLDWDILPEGLPRHDTYPPR